jgi:Tfp pilus assembly protein PilF
MVRFLTFVLMLLPSLAILAQTQSTGNCDLLVRVHGADGRAIETPVQVQLLAAQGVIANVQIVGEQSAQFRVNNGKTYRLTVSGLGIETVMTSYFDIDSLEIVHTETVQVKFTEEKSADQSNSGSTISVSDLKVPKKAATEMKKGMELYAQRDMVKAITHFEKALEIYPQYARAYDMLGVIAIKASDRSKARGLFMKSVQVDSTFQPAYVDLARMDTDEQNYEASESLLAKAIAINPADPDAVALLAATEFANKEYDKGLADVQRTHALRNHEQFAEVHLMAGKVLAMQNHPESAIAQFQMFLQEKPDSPQAASVRKALASLTATQ